MTFIEAATQPPAGLQSWLGLLVTCAGLIVSFAAVGTILNKVFTRSVRNVILPENARIEEKLQVQTEKNDAQTEKNDARLEAIEHQLKNNGGTNTMKDQIDAQFKEIRRENQDGFKEISDELTAMNIRVEVIERTMPKRADDKKES